MARLKEEAYWMQISLLTIDVVCAKDMQLSRGNLNVEVISIEVVFKPEDSIESPRERMHREK